MSSEVLYGLWGKTNDRERRKDQSLPYQWHSAMCHMVDVGHVAETWLAKAPFLRRRLIQLSGIGADVSERDLVTILVDERERDLHLQWVVVRERQEHERGRVESSWLSLTAQDSVDADSERAHGVVGMASSGVSK